MNRIYKYLFFAGLLLFVANITYSLIDKPGQALSPISHLFKKFPTQTWQNYDRYFQDFATTEISASFLAALAQSESGGNPLATVYWRWQWTKDIHKIFHPASSALGMYQITVGTFQRMKNYCWQKGVVKKQDCFWNQFRTRFSSYDSIYLVSAYLNHWVKKYPRYRDKEKMAALIHLCGPQKVKRHMRWHGNLNKITKCGTHSTRRYVNKIKRYQNTFHRLAMN